ncbi:MAG: nuclear transport factor 2 family protein [Solirubrobacteraceae bacterium]|nr:nuclear transport factor 2 family protein [Solirubrobacteraceae bacterium]
MTPRELFDSAMAAINAGDAEALLALYAPDAVQVGYEQTVVGRDALRPHVQAWLAGRPAVAEVTYAEGPDTIVFEASDGQTHGYGTIVLRDGLIWRETVGTIPAVGGGPAAGTGSAPAVELEPYRAWEPRPVPDPRTAGRDALMPAVMEIVEAEGPVLAGRAFGLYTRAAGGKKLTGAAKAPLTGATWRLKIAERLEIGREGATTIENDDVLRALGSPPIRVRALGPRTLEEVPLDEVAALMDRLCEAGAIDLKRAVLDTYGLIRLTARADQYLEQALELAAAPPR